MWTSWTKCICRSLNIVNYDLDHVKQSLVWKLYTNHETVDCTIYCHFPWRSFIGVRFKLIPYWNLRYRKKRRCAPHSPTRTFSVSQRCPLKGLGKHWAIGIKHNKSIIQNIQMRRLKIHCDSLYWNSFLVNCCTQELNCE